MKKETSKPKEKKVEEIGKYWKVTVGTNGWGKKRLCDDPIKEAEISFHLCQIERLKKGNEDYVEYVMFFDTLKADTSEILFTLEGEKEISFPVKSISEYPDNSTGTKILRNPENKKIESIRPYSPGSNFTKFAA